MHAHAYTYMIGKKEAEEKKRPFACARSVIVRLCVCVRARSLARAIHFGEQQREHKWACMYHDSM